MGFDKRTGTLVFIGVAGFLTFVAFQDPEVQRVAKNVAWIVGGVVAALAALAIFGWWVKRRRGAAGADGKVVTQGNQGHCSRPHSRGRSGGARASRKSPETILSSALAVSRYLNPWSRSIS